MGEEVLLSRLANYCSMGTYYTRALLERERLVRDAQTFACKPRAIGRDVVRHWRKRGGKAVVMLHRLHGWKALAFVLHAMGTAAGVKVACYPPCLPHEEHLTLDSVLETFNDPANDDGSQIAVLVVDAKLAGEGCSFLAVRRLYLADVPPSWQAYQQRVGRVVRFAGHCRLPAEQRSVQVRMYASVCPVEGRQCDVEGCDESEPAEPWYNNR
jgi:hypothetical protein